MTTLNKIKNGEVFKNLDKEIMTIKSVTTKDYPIKKLNGAFVDIKNDYYTNSQWMSIEAIYNFIDN